MHFDATGAKNGYNFDCFTTKYVEPPEVMPPPSSNEATPAGVPTGIVYSNTRLIAKLFWQGEGQWGSCMEKTTVQTSYGPTQPMAFMNNDGVVVFTSFKLLAEQKQGGGAVGAISVGCNSPGYDGAHNPDASIYYNSGLSWGMRKHCVAGVHEWGHQRGFTHGNYRRIMQYPAFSQFPLCQ